MGIKACITWDKSLLDIYASIPMFIKSNSQIPCLKVKEIPLNYLDNLRESVSKWNLKPNQTLLPLF